MPQHRQDNSFPDDRSLDPIQNSYRLNPDLAGGDQSKSSASPERDFGKQSAPQSAKQSSDYWLQYGAKGARTLAATLSRVTGRQSSQVLTLWPSGDFSVGNAAPPRRDNGDDPLGGIVRRPMPWLRSDDEEYFNYMLESGARPYEIAFQNRQPPRSDRQLSESEAIHLFKLIQKAEERGQSIPLEEINRVLGALAPMGLSVPRNFNRIFHERKINRPERYGGRGITAYGKKMLRSICSELEESYGRKCVAFLTCTLPSLSLQELDLVASEWHLVINRFLTWFRRIMPQTLALYAYCTEIQEHRTRLNGGHPVPHLHMVFLSRRSPDGEFLLSKEQIREAWKRALEPTVNRSLNCDYATRVETPRRSLKREIAKYLSKGGKGLKTVIDKGFGHLLPKQWWGAARQLTRIVKQKIVRYRDETVSTLVESLDLLEQVGILRAKPIKIARKKLDSTNQQTNNLVDTFDSNGQIPQTQPREMIVGYSGYFLATNPKRFLHPNQDQIINEVILWQKECNVCCKTGYHLLLHRKLKKTQAAS